MQYLLLIYANQARDLFDALPEAERSAVMGEYIAISRDPAVRGGNQLEPPATATTVRVRGGEPVITDGPFADTKEALGGYYLVEADDLDAALGLAARIPAARLGGAVEVRPVVER